MALKFFVETLDGLPADVVKEYVQHESGSGYKLDVIGAVPREKLDEFRENNIVLKRQLDNFKDVDPTKYKELLVLDQKMRDKKLFDDGKIEEMVATRTAEMKSQFESQIAERDATISANTKTLESLLIDSAVRSVATDVLPTAVDDVLLRARLAFKIQDGSAVLMNDKGQVVYGADGVTPMTVKEWIKGLEKSAPHLFKGNQGGGAHNHTGRGNFDTSKLSPTQKIQMGLGG